MSETEDIQTSQAKPIEALLCFDESFYNRYRLVLRPMCIGLLDIIPGVRMATSAPQAESLAFGPVQAVVHRPLVWPFRKKRFQNLVDIFAARPPSIVHAMSAGAYDMAVRTAREFDADLVFQAYGEEEINSLANAPTDLNWRVICGSQPLAQRCTGDAGVAAERVELIRPGVVSTSEPTCFRNPGRSATLLCTTPLLPGHGLESLLRALAMLKQAGHQCITFMLGEGPIEDALRRLARQVGVYTEVVFAQPSGDIARVMDGADIFVQPAVQHSLDIRPLQALAQGMAVVTTGGGVDDAFIDGQSARVCRPENPPDLAGCIESLLNDRANARQMASNAIALAKSRHTMNGMVEATGQLYRSLAFNRATFRIPAGGSASGSAGSGGASGGSAVEPAGGAAKPTGGEARETGGEAGETGDAAAESADAPDATVDAPEQTADVSDATAGPAQDGAGDQDRASERRQSD